MISAKDARVSKDHTSQACASSPPKILLKNINKGAVVLRELPPPKYDQRSNDKTREVSYLKRVVP